MSLTKYEQAQLWLKDLKSQIDALEKELNLIENNYKNAIDIAQQKNFMQNYIAKLNNRYSQRKNEINNILLILSNLKKEINKQINKIETLIQAAKSQPTN